ncbi:MAG: hypothetical protein KGL39_08530 [Patescibacteria group bacterium]|nr:hypothetical protein [Patescibacteria group bacterium]
MKQTHHALAVLTRDLPQAIVQQLAGHEVDVNERYETTLVVNGIQTTWALPPDAVKVVES